MSVGEMQHVLVLSDDIERTRDFYCRVVELNRIPEGGPRQLFFDDPNGVRIEIDVPAPD
jgi:hypothetical protein